MAMCTGCHRQINATEAKRQKIFRNDQGQIVSLYHGKCWVRKRRNDWVGDASGKYYADSPNAYEMSQRIKTADDLSPEALAQDAAIEVAYEELKKRQSEIAEEREKESSPQRFDDWRGPLEAEF